MTCIPFCQCRGNKNLGYLWPCIFKLSTHCRATLIARATWNWSNNRFQNNLRTSDRLCREGFHRFAFLKWRSRKLKALSCDEKYHSFLKLCKFWETSIRISPTVYQHKIFVHGAVSWFRSIDRSILRLIFPSRVLARTKRFINRWWKLTLFIVISFCIKNIYLVRLHLTSDSIMS